VPLLVRGPGVPAWRVVEELALNIDLAPTVAELAGVAVPAFVDGRSLVPLLGGAPTTDWRRGGLAEVFEVNVESGSDQSSVPPFQALRTIEFSYIEYVTGERELYDLDQDPFQLENLAATADTDLIALLSERLAAMTTCAGTECRAIEDAPLPRGDRWDCC